MEYLYVCHFSNGHIKVGRSIDPRARIAAHADRVACMGVELVEHHIAECIGRSAPAEAALIERCAELSHKRNKSEWFEGLDYLDVCEQANACASNTSNAFGAEAHRHPVELACELIGSQAELARSLKVTPPTVNQWIKGIRPIPLITCVVIENITDGKVTRQELRPNDFWKIWPDLAHLSHQTEPI